MEHPVCIISKSKVVYESLICNPYRHYLVFIPFGKTHSSLIDCSMILKEDVISSCLLTHYKYGVSRNKCGPDCLSRVSLLHEPHFDNFN